MLLCIPESYNKYLEYDEIIYIILSLSIIRSKEKVSYVENIIVKSGNVY